MHIVMTGATSGIGREAANLLLAQDGLSLTIGSRSGAGDLPQSVRLKIVPLDMDSLEAARSFATSVKDGPVIDCLILNAGLQLAEPATSADGFERTFAVNHLAHYLILRLLEDHLAPNARVILTSSGTHDPAEKTPVTPPDHANADWLAFPDRDPDLPKGTRSRCARAYSTSKLCNVMTVRELAKRHPGLSVMAFDPGYVPGTGLARDYPKWLMAIVSRVIPLLMANDRTSTVPRSGAFLTQLAVDPRHGAESGSYWAVRSETMVSDDPSALARDDAVAATLWDDSAKLVEVAA